MGNKDKATQIKKALHPYISFKTLINLIEKLGPGIPGRIDRSLMDTISGGAQVQLMSALKFLDLIQEGGVPTDKLRRLVNSEGAERQEALKTIIKSPYSFLFDNFSLDTATVHQLQEQFKNTGASGETVRKCIKFFLDAAKEAEIPLSPYVKKMQKSSGGVSRTRKALSKRPSNKSKSESPAPAQTETMEISWAKLLLSKFPSFDPAWSSEVQKKWFDAFDQLMKRGQEGNEGDLIDENNNDSGKERTEKE